LFKRFYPCFSRLIRRLFKEYRTSSLLDSYFKIQCSTKKYQERVIQCQLTDPLPLCYRYPSNLIDYHYQVTVPLSRYPHPSINTKDIFFSGLHGVIPLSLVEYSDTHKNDANGHYCDFGLKNESTIRGIKECLLFP